MWLSLVSLPPIFPGSFVELTVIMGSDWLSGPLGTTISSIYHLEDMTQYPTQQLP